MVTNNVRDLELGRGVYCFLLSPQGHIQADLYCYQRGEYLLLDSDAAQAKPLHELLQKYVVMDDVELAELGSKLSTLAVAGPRAADVLKASGILAREFGPLEVQDVVFRLGTAASQQEI